MPSQVGSNPTLSLTPSGTQSVKIVAWDSTGAGSLPAGTAALGAVSIIAGTATLGISGTVTTLIATGTQVVSGIVTLLAGTGTQNVNVVVSTAVAMSGTGNVLIGGATTVSGLLITTAGPFYQQNATAIAATGTGVLVMGVQSGATTSRALMITTTGDLRTFLVGTSVISGNVTLTASIPAGNVLIGSMNIVGSVPAGNVIMGSVTVVGITTTADGFAIQQGGFLRYLTAATNVQFARIAIITSGDAIIVTSAANKSVVVLSLMLNANGPNAAVIASSVSAKPIGPTMFLATSGVGMVLGKNEDGWFRTTVGESLVINLASSGSCAGCITYVAVTT